MLSAVRRRRGVACCYEPGSAIARNRSGSILLPIIPVVRGPHEPMWRVANELQR